MEHRDILKGAIGKAVSNGWDLRGFADRPYEVCKRGEYYQVWFGLKDGEEEHPPFIMYENNIIFHHGFAKALWGEQEICVDCGLELIPKETSERWDKMRAKGSGKTVAAMNEWIDVRNSGRYCIFQDDYDDPHSSEPAWKYHLKEMVITPDPVLYLTPFITS